jgi:hypothetical protein
LSRLIMKNPCWGTMCVAKSGKNSSRALR